MLQHPNELAGDPDKIEAIEKASLRMVAQGLFDYAKHAQDIFAREKDKPADIAEDITREALDNLGMSKITDRLFGKIDYKRARYVFHPEYSVKQALFVDSKAERVAAQGTATIQMSQTSMHVRQIRAGREYNVAGALPQFIETEEHRYLTTTVFAKYNYDVAVEDTKFLDSITVIALPNGALQQRYNPHSRDGIWRAGRDAPTLGEDFRVRVHLHSLRQKARWRVQRVRVSPTPEFIWEG